MKQNVIYMKNWYRSKQSRTSWIKNGRSACM